MARSRQLVHKPAGSPFRLPSHLSERLHCLSDRLQKFSEVQKTDEECGPISDHLHRSQATGSSGQDTERPAREQPYDFRQFEGLGIYVQELVGLRPENEST
jgi:hypothetical protein